MADLIITTSDLLEALQELLEGRAEDDNGAMTARELSDLLHADNKKLLDCLGQLKSQGMLEVTRVYRVALDDRRMPVPAYRFKKIEKEAEDGRN